MSRPESSTDPRWFSVVWLILMPILYGILLLVGIEFYIEPENVATIWPASGVALGILLLFPYRLWPVFLFLQAATHFLLCVFELDYSVLFSALATASTVFGSFSSAIVVRIICGPRFELTQSKHVLVLFAAVVAGESIGALAGAWAVTSIFSNSSFWEVWIVWCFSDVVGAMLVAPVIFGTGVLLREPFHWPGNRSIVEFAAIVISTVGLGHLIFGASNPFETAVFSYPYLIAPIILLAAVRTRPPIASFTIMLAGFMIVYYSDRGLGPFVHATESTHSLVHGIQMFLAVSCLLVMVLSAAVAERAHVGAKLRASESRYRTIVQNLPGIVYRSTTSHPWKMSYVSDGIQSVTGYPVASFVPGPRRFGDLVHPDDQTRVVEQVTKSIDTGNPFSLEYRILHADGSERYVIERGRVVYNDQGAATQLEGVILDATTRYRAEQQLEWESAVHTGLADLAAFILKEGDTAQTGIAEQKLLTLAARFTGSRCGSLAVIDDNGHLVGEAISFDDTLHRTPNDGSRLSFAREADGRFPHLLGHCVNTGEPFFTNDPLTHPAFDGEVPGCCCSIECFMGVPITVDDELAGQIALMNGQEGYSRRELDAVTQLANLYAIYLGRRQSIQNRAYLEQQLRQAQKMEAVGTLAGGIAHDFNNILGGIFGYSELLQQTMVPGSRESSYLDTILSAAERAKELTRQILMFSRKNEEHRKVTALQPIVEESLQLLRKTIPSTVDIQANLNATVCNVLGDSTQIHQVIMNLCTNAWHALPGGEGRIFVTLSKTYLNRIAADRIGGLLSGFYALLSVTDTGTGMTPDVMARIFDPFFTTKEQGKGTGMGLSVVHGIVKSHGGAVAVESKPGQGTCFSVYLPIAETAEHTLRVEDTPPETGTERILFLDDEPMLAELGKQILEQKGYQVFATTDPRGALKLFSEAPQRFDMLITDQTMPGMTGEQLAREVMKIRPGFPVIICTGHSETINSDKAHAMGVRAFIMKPLRIKELQQVVRSVFDQSL